MPRKSNAASKKSAATDASIAEIVEEVPTRRSTRTRKSVTSTVVEKKETKTTKKTSSTSTASGDDIERPVTHVFLNETPSIEQTLAFYSLDHLKIPVDRPYIWSMSVSTTGKHYFDLN